MSGLGPKPPPMLILGYSRVPIAAATTRGWLHLRGKPFTPVSFVHTWMYSYCRHPMMAAILVGQWATPHMTLTHLMLAIGLNIYIAIVVTFEDRDLMVRFGEYYRQPRRQFSLLTPRLWT